MRKLLCTIIISVLAVSCFGIMIIPAIAQETSDSTNSVTPPPLIVRWLRFRGAVTEWGDEPYHGSLVVNAKTANVLPALFRPWATVNAVWSNEQRPISSDTKPVGQVTYTHYTARLVLPQVIKGKLADNNYDLNVTGIWNVNRVTITSEFDANGRLLNSAREVTSIAARARGQLHITEDWKKFALEIEDIDVVGGKGIAMTTARNQINPFSYQDAPRPTISDLVELVKSFRTMPGFGNYLPEFDYNLDSKIDLTDLTTVAANM